MSEHSRVISAGQWPNQRLITGAELRELQGRVNSHARGHNTLLEDDYRLLDSIISFVCREALREVSATEVLEFIMTKQRRP